MTEGFVQKGLREAWDDMQARHSLKSQLTLGDCLLYHYDDHLEHPAQPDNPYQRNSPELDNR